MSVKSLDAMPREVARAIELIKPVLHGRPPEMIGAILADLLAIWLAGYHVEDDADATRSLRAELLAMHCRTVGALVPINAKSMGTPP
jgi:hypothetical protein